MTVALYPGTFDPIHYGHIDIAARAAALFDKLVLAVYDRPIKNLLFSTKERVALARQALASLPNVTVASYNKLTVGFAKQQEASVMVRGLRVTYDFELEYQMALTNKSLAPDVETVLLITNLQYAFVSSSIVKEVAMAGGCIAKMVPEFVQKALEKKIEALGKTSSDKVKMVSLRD
ncbi:MAG: pantetheine-phosphate adenylyltransferase [Anaerolineaceae bacterium 4572_32.1]|nr:MAG: pantetheine-phosphate adenylyltransferase [Anaerolineaceae bacterium 4572_32.1]